MVIERRFETVWEVPDVLWEQIEPVLLEADPPNPRGRPQADARRALDGIIFRLRSGCQWNRLPKEFGDDSTIHRTFQRWVDRAYSQGYGRCWCKSVKISARCNGVGSRPTPPWVKPVWGGSYWTQSNGPGQGREQAKHPG